MTALAVVLLLGVGWWTLRPPAPARPLPAIVRGERRPPATTSETTASLVARWPEGTLEGEPAKRLLVACLTRASERLGRTSGYTALLHRRERIGGVLGTEQVQEIKVRHRPFSVYMKYLSPLPGREVVYDERRNGGKLVVHNGDWTRRIIPRLTISPDDPIAMNDNRHPITEMGLAHITSTLLRFAEMDLTDPGAATILDRPTDPDGRPWLRSRHEMDREQPARPFARVEVHYDPDSLLPRRFVGYEWPRPGDSPAEYPMAESYAYDDLDLDVTLTDLDFDPANPAYAFSRF